MEQTIQTNGRRTGWSDSETNLLWETAEEAEKQGVALKTVFEQIAKETGRRPNSIRNYYYAQVRQRLGDTERTQRFIPFEEEEVLALIENVLRDRAKGKSVRSCLQRISSGDHSLMLRYQNKYRSVIKTRPELVQQVVSRLQAEGIDCKTPEVKTRSRLSLSDVMGNLTGTAKTYGDPELVRALETIGDYLLGNKSRETAGKGNLSVKLDLYRLALDEQRNQASLMSETAMELIAPIKEFIMLSSDEKHNNIDSLVTTLTARIGALEECVVSCEEEP